MHLSTLYARDLGVYPKKPIIKEHFFPLPCEKYITFHNSEKIQSKAYSYWKEVFDIIKPFLKSQDIKIVQVGTKEDKEVHGVDFCINNTTYKQSFFLIKNAILHVGIDSSPVHVAAAFNKPTVSIYGHTYAQTCSPLWNEKKKIIESHRNGNKPSFSLEETVKTIDMINPEEIAQAILDLLGFNQTLSYKTIHIGSNFLQKEINLIPSRDFSVFDADDADINVRLDMRHDEKFLFKVLVNYKNPINIFCSKPISNFNHLMNFKQKINKVNYYSDEFDKDFIDLLKSNVFKLNLFCTSKDNLDDQRLKFFDNEIDYFNPKEQALENKEKYYNLIGESFKIKTGRIYLCDNDKFKTLGENIEDWKFWLDFNHMMIYNE